MLSVLQFPVTLQVWASWLLFSSPCTGFLSQGVKEACASSHCGLCRYFLLAKSAKSCWTNCPLSSLLLECPWSPLLDNHILFFQFTVEKHSCFIYPHTSFNRCSVGTRQDFVIGQYCPTGWSGDEWDMPFFTASSIALQLKHSCDTSVKERTLKRLCSLQQPQN